MMQPKRGDVSRESKGESDQTGFSGRLRELIGTSTYRDFARRCGFADSLVRKYANGQSVPGMDNLLAIARAAGVNLEWLASGRPPKFDNAATAARTMERVLSAIKTTGNTSRKALSASLIAHEASIGENDAVPLLTIDEVDRIVWRRYVANEADFLQTLFRVNHRQDHCMIQNAGFFLAFDDEMAGGIAERVATVVKRFGRSSFYFNFTGRKFMDECRNALLRDFATHNDASRAIHELITGSKSVIVVRGLSSVRDRFRGELTGKDMIVSLADSHIRGNSTEADLIFIDNASFLQDLWDSGVRSVLICPPE